MRMKVADQRDRDAALTEQREVASFWRSPTPVGAGLASRRTVKVLMARLEDRRAAETTTAMRPQSPEQGDDEGVPAEPRPATCIAMEPGDGVVSVRRAGDGLLLGVIIERPRDGAGICFQPVRSPSAIRELFDDGIIG